MHKVIVFQKHCSKFVVTRLPRNRHRHFLKGKDTKKFLLEVTETLGQNIAKLLGSKTRVEVDEIETHEIFIFNQRPLLARYDRRLFPLLSFNEIFSIIPKIVVDMGAVPYVCKGADVMAPGVRETKGVFEEKDIVLVVDERYGKPLAVGLALSNSEAMKVVKHGKIVKNLHYVGDQFWNYLITTSS